MGKNNDEIYLYQRGNSPFWYFRYVTATGEVVRESTKKKNRSEALLIAEERIRELDYHQENPSFRNAILMYCNPETNPRFIMAKKEGKMYGSWTARCVSSTFNHLYKILDDRFPKIMEKKITEIKKKDIIIIKDILMDEDISETLSNTLFVKLSPLFGYYMSTGLLEYNPCTGITPPRKDIKEKISLEPEVISVLINSKDRFESVRYWAFLTVIASTGMRYGEALAINKAKFNGNIYTIDVAVKNISNMEIGKPKRNLVRTIPFPKIASVALSQIDVDENGYFFKKHHKEYDSRSVLRNICKQVCPGFKHWDNMKGWHNFRHSLNTNLLLEPDLNPALIAEYLSWEHQVQSLAMQKHYTHIYAKNLQVVADKIDEIYSSKAK